MSETNKNISVSPDADIRIVGLNREKTRKTTLSDPTYQVYFELSEAPPQPWRNCFEQEWKTLTPAQPTLWQGTNIDGRFLVMHCTLPEVGVTYLPVLKKAVAAANASYKTYIQGQATEQGRQVDVWKLERKSVNDMADSLHFD